MQQLSVGCTRSAWHNNVYMFVMFGVAALVEAALN